MELSSVIERVERVAAVRADSSGCADLAQTALVDIRDIRAFLDSSEAVLTRRIAQTKSFPEAAIADATRGSLRGASRTLDRASTLDATPTLADALDAATVTAGHVDVVTRAAKSLNTEQRTELLDRVNTMVGVAETATVAEFGRRVRAEASRIAAEDGMNRLERQRRATTLSTWVDPEGMWCLKGRFDPVTGLTLASRLENTIHTLFAETVPDDCPSDPIEKQKHLRALALARLIQGAAGDINRGRPEFVAVIDITPPPPSQSANAQSDLVPGSDTRPPGSDPTRPPGSDPTRPATRTRPRGQGSDPNKRTGSDPPTASAEPDNRVNVEWPIPIEIPQRVLADLIADADVTTVVVRNGVVLHAPGELDLGRTTRLANRAQRRALRALYRTCAIPGCTTSYSNCKLHHIIWWRHGGRTDLDNLIPVCSRHHHKIHDHHWKIHLGPNRQLTLTLPDGTVHNTSPPNRNAA
jgi:hypothetical protein